MSELRSISNFLPNIAKSLFGKKTMLFGKLIAEWHSIVGVDIASKAIPIELKYSKSSKKKNQAILHIATNSADSLEISYQKDIIKERLNIFFGYSAIKDIKIIHKKIVNTKHKKPKKVIKRLSQDEEVDIDKKLDKIEEKDLKIALKNLGKAIILRDK